MSSNHSLTDQINRKSTFFPSCGCRTSAGQQTQASPLFHCEWSPFGYPLLHAFDSLKVLLCYLLTTLYLHSAKVTLERVLKLSVKEGKILGTSKVGPKFRITLVKEVQQKLKAKIGDIIVYLEEPDGKIVLRAISYEQLLKTVRK